MAKRFGRNQRRQMRQALAQQKANAVATHSKLLQENASLRNKLAKAIVINVDVLRDHSRMAYEARMSAHMDARDGYYVAQRIDQRQLEMQRERDRFIEHAAMMMAHELARAIGEKWGSGRNPFSDFIS